MYWRSQDCLSVLYRLTVRNAGQRHGNMQRGMVSRLYSWNRKQHNFSVFYGQNDGCRPVVLTVFCLQNRKIWDIFYYERIQGGLYGGQEIFWIYACQQPGTE